MRWASEWTLAWDGPWQAVVQARQGALDGVLATSPICAEHAGALDGLVLLDTGDGFSRELLREQLAGLAAANATLDARGEVAVRPWAAELGRVRTLEPTDWLTVPAGASRARAWQALVLEQPERASVVVSMSAAGLCDGSWAELAPWDSAASVLLIGPTCGASELERAAHAIGAQSVAVDGAGEWLEQVVGHLVAPCEPQGALADLSALGAGWAGLRAVRDDAVVVAEQDIWIDPLLAPGGGLPADSTAVLSAVAGLHLTRTLLRRWGRR